MGGPVAKKVVFFSREIYTNVYTINSDCFTYILGGVSNYMLGLLGGNHNLCICFSEGLRFLFIICGRVKYVECNYNNVNAC